MPGPFLQYARRDGAAGAGQPTLTRAWDLLDRAPSVAAHRVLARLGPLPRPSARTCDLCLRRAPPCVELHRFAPICAGQSRSAPARRGFATGRCVTQCVTPETPSQGASVHPPGRVLLTRRLIRDQPLGPFPGRPRTSRRSSGRRRWSPGETPSWRGPSWRCSGCWRRTRRWSPSGCRSPHG
jgi:hypothetical protein